MPARWTTTRSSSRAGSACCQPKSRPEFVASQGLQAYRQHVKQSSDAARVDAVGYVLVREFRATLLSCCLRHLPASSEAQGRKFADLHLAPEVPGWR